MKLLSVAIPSYNSEQYMKKCIESLLVGGEDVEILIVDEILAVGDVAFQKKCKERMHEMLKGGTTLLLVSHTIRDITALCTKAMWLKNGCVEKVGEVYDVVNSYLESKGAPLIERPKKSS